MNEGHIKIRIEIDHGDGITTTHEESMPFGDRHDLSDHEQAAVELMTKTMMAISSEHLSFASHLFLRSSAYDKLRGIDSLYDAWDGSSDFDQTFDVVAIRSKFDKSEQNRLDVIANNYGIKLVD
jgi:hypothetical protein